MYDTETLTLVLEDIRSHASPLTSGQEEFVEACEETLEDFGDLSSSRIARLYEILDDLDERAGAERADDESDQDAEAREWWADEFPDEDEDDRDDDDAAAWDEREFWN